MIVNLTETLRGQTSGYACEGRFRLNYWAGKTHHNYELPPWHCLGSWTEQKVENGLSTNLCLFLFLSMGVTQIAALCSCHCAILWDCALKLRVKMSLSFAQLLLSCIVTSKYCIHKRLSQCCHTYQNFSFAFVLFYLITHFLKSFHK